jgi:hypothetical protein
MRAERHTNWFTEVRPLPVQFQKLRKAAIILTIVAGTNAAAFFLGRYSDAKPEPTQEVISITIEPLPVNPTPDVAPSAPRFLPSGSEKLLPPAPPRESNFRY